MAVSFFYSIFSYNGRLAWLSLSNANVFHHLIGTQNYIIRKNANKLSLKGGFMDIIF